MKKILTIVAIVTIFASSFASAATVTTGVGGKQIFNLQAKSSKTVKTSKINSFSIKGMQDTKDILLGSSDNTTTTIAG